MLAVEKVKKTPLKHKTVGPDVLFPDLSYRLMEIAYEVHNELGPGFTEDIYEKAFVRELCTREIPYEEQKPITVAYKGDDIGIYRLDLLVEGNIIVELKAVSGLNELHKQQVRSYLKATGLKLGFLINFGTLRVESYRVINLPRH